MKSAEGAKNMMIEKIPDTQELKEKYFPSPENYQRGVDLFIKDRITVVNREGSHFRVLVEDRFDDFEVSLNLEQEPFQMDCHCHSDGSACSHEAAALLYVLDELEEELEEELENRSCEEYTREEMIHRVLKERRERANKEEYTVRFGENMYGFHEMGTAAGKRYQLTIRDFETSNGYCSCPDFKTNKLGTCKHLIYLNNKLKEKYSVDSLLNARQYPFVEIFCDPLQEYQITYFYKGDIDPEVAGLLNQFFPEDKIVKPETYREFLTFLDQAREIKKILVRPEVFEKIERFFEEEELIKLSKHTKLDFSKIKATLFDYQREGIEFSVFKRGNIIADEMGLGKTLQAITIGVMKKEIFDFKRVLIICPASLKFQWKQEIEKFSEERAVIVSGTKDARQACYKNAKEYFVITNYESVLRDITTLVKYPPDMVILDEAQRIKNYDTKTSHAVKAIPRKHSLIITGTPIENRLIDLYSVMNFIDPEYLAPLWEFSMNHCYFDKSKKNKINGYYNLQQLKEKLKDKIIRRQKKEVLDQLPEVQEITIPIALTAEQLEIHAGFAQSLMPILGKKHKTVYDMQRIFQILTSMRMVCDSTYLIDKETNLSPKLKELEEILVEKMDILNQKRKVIIFSEWRTMLHLIEKMLRKHHIGYTMLSGKIPVDKRGNLVEEFHQNPDCLVFLSTEAGGAGLNLQVADTVINFELPWNPAKKNQRIGRVHRIGQQSSHITVINLVAQESIEERISTGIVLKESLFNAVLNEADGTEEVDFSAKGRATMIDQIQKMVTPLAVLPDNIWQPEEQEPVEMDTPLDEPEEEVLEETSPIQESKAPTPTELEDTLNKGLAFLNGVLSMATGKELITQDQSITVDKETGEVVMRFKLPI